MKKNASRCVFNIFFGFMNKLILFATKNNFHTISGSQVDFTKPASSILAEVRGVLVSAQNNLFWGRQVILGEN